jgi:hypothetical protein
LPFAMSDAAVLIAAASSAEELLHIL